VSTLFALIDSSGIEQGEKHNACHLYCGWFVAADDARMDNFCNVWIIEWCSNHGNEFIYDMQQMED